MADAVPDVAASGATAPLSVESASSNFANAAKYQSDDDTIVQSNHTILMPTRACISFYIPPLHRAVLEIVKSAQAQNGLRHNDYERYRQYCTRRLDRIRHAPAVHFTHGKKKFVKRELTAEECTDPRHLQIPLVQAERAWAQAMAQKQDEAGVATAAARHRLVGRLRKAAKHGEELKSLAAARGDARTALEAEAYAAWLRGVLHLEIEDWENALAAFSTARAIYEQLAKVAARRSRDLYLQRVEELTPNERYCRYNLMRRQGRGAAAKAAAAASSSAGEGGAPASGELDAKIAAALAEGKSGGGSGAGSSVNTVVWRRTTLPVRSDKLRSALQQAAAKSAQLAALTETATSSSSSSGNGSSSSSSAASGGEKEYLDVLSRYDDVIRIAGDEAGRAAKEGKEALAGDYRALGDYARFCKLRHAADRSDAMAQAAAAALDKPVATAAAAAASAGSSSSNSGGNVYASHPWLASLMGLGAGGDVSGSKASRAAAAASVAAASQVAALYARSIKTLEEMASLCGDANSGADGSGSDASSSSPSGKASSSSSSSASSSSAELPADTALAAALAARKAAALAQRCWYVALSYARAKRYSDAAALLGRADERIGAALAAYSGLTSSSSSSLPAQPVSITSDEPGLDSDVVLSGVSAADVTGLQGLRARVAHQGVALKATALLEGLAPRLRPDADLLAAYAAGFAGDSPSAPPAPPKSRPAPPVSALARGPRPAYLLDRLDTGACLEPTADAGAIAPWPPAAVATPVKPILFDLAFSSVANYPESLAAAPAPAPAAAKPAAASTPQKGTPTKAAAPASASARVGPGASAKVGPGGSGTPSKAAASAAPGSASKPKPAASDEPPPSPSSSSGGSGLLGWFTGR